MNNEPVAWMDKESNVTMIGGIYPKKLEQYLSGLEARVVALESHPAKTLDRELLDKIIIDQQNEIKELRKNLDVALMIVNEPVAWMNKINNEWVTTTKDGDDDEWIPLYTHPAKTLTDREIMQEWTWKYSDCFEDFLLQFARAILRKAK